MSERLVRLAVTRNGGEELGDPPVQRRPMLPPTEREIRDRELIREDFRKMAALALPLAEERYELETELRKIGPLPPPELPPGYDVDVLRSAYHQLQNKRIDDHNEIERLWKELKQRDPRAAARLRKELAAPK